MKCHRLQFIIFAIGSFFLLNQEMKWFNNQSHSNIIDAKTKLHGKFSCKVTGLQPLIKHKTVSI